MYVDRKFAHFNNNNSKIMILAVTTITVIVIIITTNWYLSRYKYGQKLFGIYLNNQLSYFQDKHNIKANTPFICCNCAIYCFYKHTIFIFMGVALWHDCSLMQMDQYVINIILNYVYSILRWVLQLIRNSFLLLSFLYSKIISVG